jgi:hypothetical protein
MDTKWLSYEELGEALGITPASAKRLAIRRKWAKKPGNDGRTRVAVPIEKLETGKPTASGDSHRVITGDVPSDAASDDTGDRGDTAAAIAAVLSRHIARLEAELENTKAKLETTERERDEERARAADLALKAAQVEVLNGALETERKHADELRRDRDRWAVQAHALAHPPVPAVPERRSWFSWGRKWA